MHAASPRSLLPLGFALALALGASTACAPRTVRTNRSISGSRATTTDATVRPVPRTNLPIRRTIQIDGAIAHPEGGFTEGLLFFQGRLFESVGLYAQSRVRELDPRTGRVLHEVENDKEHFGEGLAVMDQTLVQLTWQEGVALRWSTQLSPAGAPWRFEGEGWGLTFLPERRVFAMSDGSSAIRFRRTTDFGLQGPPLVVRRQGAPLERINELEYARGHLFANVYPDGGPALDAAMIYEIDPVTGVVLAEMDGRPLARREAVGADREMNGIAFEPVSGRFYLTGKHWSSIYIARFVDSTP